MSFFPYVSSQVAAAMPGAVRVLSSATRAGISDVRDVGGAGNTCSSQVTNGLSWGLVPWVVTQLAMRARACSCWAETSVAVLATWAVGNRGGGGLVAMRSFAEVFAE